ncbi:tRNA adenosine(34) deaminase TadA [Spiribacter salilacus]|nr:tRNA adenosine(34) deaminase TadA [Spiribacter salilacus]
MNHTDYMRRAYALAQQAAEQGEVPVGALLVQGDQVLAEAHNAPIGLHDPSAHAEMLTLRQAGQAIQAYRLPDTTLYVTLEPCPMCIGALIHARVGRVVFGAHDPKTGACGSAMSLHAHTSHNHQIEVIGGVLEKDCAALLREFFKQRRAGHLK